MSKLKSLKPIHALATAAFLFLAAFSLRAAQTTHAAGDIDSKTVTIGTPDGEKLEAELGTFYVRENRQDPKSRVIGIGFARFKGEATGAPPTFHLPGGPANSYLRNLNITKEGAARVMPAAYAADIALYRKISDVVYFDQRGYSELGDVLMYSYTTKDYPLTEPNSLQRERDEFIDVARGAMAEFKAKGIDLTGYTAHECAADVFELRKALGYDKVILIGQSFGCQWSFATMRLYPQIVARAVLSGIEPIDLGYDMPSHVYSSMRRQWYFAEQDPKLKPYLPPGGIAGAVREIIKRLEKAPLQVPVKDPKSEQTVTITLGRDDFRPGEPANILAIYHGHYDEWARTALNRRRSHKGNVALIGPLIDTALAVTPLRRYLLRTDAAVDVIGQWNFDDYMATEELWPTTDVGDEFRTEVQNATPVLFVQGDWDLSTPMENLVQVLPFFVNSRTMIVHHGEHGAYARVRRTLPAATAAVMEFIRSGNTVNLPSHVTVPPKEFRVPTYPAPRGKPA